MTLAQNAELKNVPHTGGYPAVFLPASNGRDAASNVWRSQVAAALSGAGLVREADAFLMCQDESTIRFVQVCSENPEHQATPIAHTCHLRVCPECEARNSARLHARYYKPILDIVSARRKKRGLRHIVLTTPFSLEDSDIKEKLRWAYNQVGRLFDYMLPIDWQHKDMGYIVGCEFGEEGHKLHFHILFYGPYIDNAEMLLIWNVLTGSTVLPWITLVDGRKHSLHDAVSEVVKYVCKLTQLSPDLVPALLEAIRGTRRIRCKGLFYGLPMPEKQLCVCKVCGKPTTMWTKEKFDAWRAGQLASASAKLIERLAASPLVLKLGNKFSDAGVIGEGPIVQKSFDWDNEPPRRDYNHVQPPLWAGN